MIVLLVTSCDRSNKKTTAEVKKGTKDTAITSPVTTTPGTGKDYEKIKEDLEKLTPLSPEQLEKLAPAELAGATRSEVSVNSSMGTGMVSATYLLPDNADLHLTIFDCAGAGGAGLFGVQYLNLLDMNSNDEGEYTTTVPYKGGKAIEYCEKSSNDCSLSWFAGDRYLVVLEGKGTRMEVLKHAGNGLKL
jgi:hypothetical protein